MKSLRSFGNDGPDKKNPLANNDSHLNSSGSLNIGLPIVWAARPYGNEKVHDFLSAAFANYIPSSEHLNPYSRIFLHGMGAAMDIAGNDIQRIAIIYAGISENDSLKSDWQKITGDIVNSATEYYPTIHSMMPSLTENNIKKNVEEKQEKEAKITASAE